jgi:hypothetical protein
MMLYHRRGDSPVAGFESSFYPKEGPDQGNPSGPGSRWGVRHRMRCCCECLRSSL